MHCPAWPRPNNPQTPRNHSQFTKSQFDEPLRGRAGRVLGSFVDHLEVSCDVFAEHGAYRGQAGGDEGTFADPVVVEVAVDGADVVGEVDVDAGGDHGDEGEKEGVW